MPHAQPRTRPVPPALYQVEFIVHARPAPQGSKVPRRDKKSGKMWVQEQTHERLKSWRGAVVEAGEDAMRGGPPLEGPVELEVFFTMGRPQAHYRTGKFANELKPGAPLYHSGTPDLSKLIRATEDALTDAGVWKDDKQVARVRAAKVFPGTCLLAQNVPGAYIRVTEIEGEIKA